MGTDRKGRAFRLQLYENSTALRSVWQNYPDILILALINIYEFREQQIQTIRSRVINHENHLGKLCTLLTEYMTTCAQVRDKNDEIAKCVAKIALDEKYDTIAKFQLARVGDILADVGDQRNAQVQRMEGKVIPILSPYGIICKNLKVSIQEAITAHGKALVKKKKTENLRRKLPDKSGDRIVSSVESDLEKLYSKSSHLHSKTQSQMLKFEQQRMQDVKETLLAFFKVEMAMHVKALEYLTEAYSGMVRIDEDLDLKAVKRGMSIEDVSHPHTPISESHSPRTKPSEGEFLGQSWMSNFTTNYVEEIKQFHKSTMRRPESRKAPRPNSAPTKKTPLLTNSESEITEETEENKNKKSHKAVSFEESDGSMAGRDLYKPPKYGEYRPTTAQPKKSALTKRH